MSKVVDIAAIQPGLGGAGLEYLGDGWSWPEGDFRWMTGEISNICLPAPADPENIYLVIDYIPFGNQHVRIKANGIEFAEFTSMIDSVSGFCIPAGLVSRGPNLEIEFVHPNHQSISADKRELSLAVKSIQLVQSLPRIRNNGSKPDVSMSDADLMSTFESLGDNCEFGIAQLRKGADPLGLLRFAGISVADTIRGLEAGFDGISKHEDLNLDLEGPENGPKEYIITHRRYRMVFHSMRYETESVESFLGDYKKKFEYLARKLRDDLSRGEKIFVCKRNPFLFYHEVLPLWLAVRRYGEGTLLWVEQATDERPPGSVEWVLDGLMRGYIERFAPSDDVADRTDGEHWLTVCRAAHNLYVESLGGGSDPLADSVPTFIQPVRGKSKRRRGSSKANRVPARQA